MNSRYRIYDIRIIYQNLLGYDDVFYDKPNNENFQNKIKKYNKEHAITGAIPGTSKEKNYDELGLHLLSNRR